MWGNYIVLTLNMTDASTGVALFSCNSTWAGTSRGLVARLTTVVAKPLLRCAVLSDMADCENYWNDFGM